MNEFSAGCRRSASAKAASVNSPGETSVFLILGAYSEMVILSRSALDMFTPPEKFLERDLAAERTGPNGGYSARSMRRPEKTFERSRSSSFLSSEK